MGTVESFCLKPNDLFDFQQINGRIVSGSDGENDWELQSQPRNIQHFASLVGEKFCFDKDDEKELTIYVKSEKESVFLSEGVSDGNFSRTLVLMLSI